MPREPARVAPSSYRLIGRAPGDIVFRTGSDIVSAQHFLVLAHALAARLPDCPHTANLCIDRLHFTLAMAAIFLRRQVMLLSGDRTPDRLARLRQDFADLATIVDSDVAAVVAARPAGDADNPLLPADQPAALVFTSGTTGEPVAHAKSFGSLVRRAQSMRVLFGPDAATVVGTVPPQHMYGFETTVLLPLHAPVAVSRAAAFYHADITHALAAVPEPRILVTTPMQLRLLLEAAAPLPPLARVVSATAPMPPELAAAAEARWQTEIHEIYGATEVGTVARRRTLDGDVWTLFPDVTLRQAAAAVDVEAPHAIPTPLNDEIAQEDAGFRLIGRKADMVKLAGKRASLAGLNRILNGIAGVRDGLFVAPDDLDDRPGARLLAYVVAPERSSADILADLRRLVEPAFLPRRIVRVEGLPRNELGKLPRQALATLREQP